MIFGGATVLLSREQIRRKPYYAGTSSAQTSHGVWATAEYPRLTLPAAPSAGGVTLFDLIQLLRAHQPNTEKPGAIGPGSPNSTNYTCALTALLPQRPAANLA